MKAIQISRFGGPDVLTLAEVPAPAPGPGQVLIRVAAAGVNFAETLMRENNYVAAYTLPAIPGSELTGTIEALGEGVDDLKVGQRVGAVLPAAKVLTGGYAEYAVADAKVTVPLPEAIDFEQATALLVQGLTAYYLAREISPEGRDVLVTAAGGGVGSLLIQLARIYGATRVTAAASSETKRAAALGLGADTAVDYEQWAELKPTLIYDSVGGNIFPRCLEVLGARGVLVAYGALNLQSFALDIPDLKRMVFSNQSLRGFAFGALLEPASMRRDLATLFDMVIAGDLKVLIGGRFPLADAAKAHHALADRSTIGKLLLLP